MGLIVAAYNRSVAPPFTFHLSQASTSNEESLQPVPEDVIPRGTLAPLRYRDLPEPVPLRRMIGPSVILAGLALGSGEFVFWPYIVYKSGFIFIWACFVGLTTQFFMNMEITRWTLATGESALTGFARLSKHWAGVFLVLNIVPWMIPAWAVGAAQLISWLVWGVSVDAAGQVSSPYVTEMAIAGLFLCGIILTAGPVIYETVEKVQMFLVAAILLIVIVLACFMVRGDALAAMAGGVSHFGELPHNADLPRDLLLGAIAFAGAGGTVNLGQSNYVKEKGYGMGHYIGRITSPITGKEEPVSEIGYHFPATPENLSRWRRWWRAANVEHFLSFFMTCLVCLTLLTLISYSIFYQSDGTLHPEAAQHGKDMNFVWGEALEIEKILGGSAKVLFLLMGVAILFTTEFGVLDVASRISTDIVKVNWLGESKFWSEGRLYYAFLWGSILLGAGILLAGIKQVEGGFFLFKLTAALNGAVMFIYCSLLAYLNYFKLPAAVRMSKFRLAIMLWGVLFFGFFAVWALLDRLGMLEP